MFDLNARLGSHRRYLDVGRTNSFWDGELVVAQKARCGLAIGSCAISGTEDPINSTECTKPNAGGPCISVKTPVDAVPRRKSQSDRRDVKPRHFVTKSRDERVTNSTSFPFFLPFFRLSSERRRASVEIIRDRARINRRDIVRRRIIRNFDRSSRVVCGNLICARGNLYIEVS